MRVHFVYIKYKGRTLFDEVAVERTFGIRGSDRKKIILRAEKIWHAKKNMLILIFAKSPFDIGRTISFYSFFGCLLTGVEGVYMTV